MWKLSQSLLNEWGLFRMVLMWTVSLARLVVINGQDHQPHCRKLSLGDLETTAKGSLLSRSWAKLVRHLRAETEAQWAPGRLSLPGQLPVLGGCLPCAPGSQGPVRGGNNPVTCSGDAAALGRATN